jgi:SAM-dependent methyltransferase
MTSALLAEPRTLPPGTILQRIYVRKRLQGLRPGRFVHVGTGEGSLSRVLLDLGWTGSGWDLNESALERARALMKPYIDARQYELRHGDWLASEPGPPSDLVVSEMLLEHLDDKAEHQYFERAVAELTSDGLGILLVPGSERHWGIEDEVAGHRRRYTRESLRRAVESAGCRVERLVGLTWPLSNVLLPISNRLVRRAEAQRLTLNLQRRTIASGHRNVPWKTRFPPVARLVLNEWALRPFHLAQLAGSQRESALILYCEFRDGSAG